MRDVHVIFSVVTFGSGIDNMSKVRFTDEKCVNDSVVLQSLSELVAEVFHARDELKSQLQRFYRNLLNIHFSLLGVILGCFNVLCLAQKQSFFLSSTQPNFICPQRTICVAA